MNSPRVPADPTPAVARGGTFVRPGALAWGRDRADTPGRAGSDVVEDALAAAVKDPDRLTDLLDELGRGRLWVPLPGGEGPVTDGSAVRLPTVIYLGGEFVPAFTSAERLASWSLDASADVPHIVVPAAELARRLPPDMGIALNPGAETSVPIYPEGVSHLALADAPASSGPASSGPASSGPASSGPASSGPVRVGHPPADPVALLGEVRATLDSVPAVRQASRAWLCVPGQGEGLVISVALRDPASPQAHQAVIAAVERAASAVPHQFPIDVTFPGEGAPDQVDEWISAHAEPFYVRT
jgi:SseB protein N-terminal domain/SseB protein C-terminal domain